MKKVKNILSLFDGMSCGQIALNKLGIEYENYYASEIDKYAMSVTQYHYPSTIQLGDINDWEKWDIDFSSIDLILTGFPCQTWSLAGNQMGDRDPRGMLFWTMLDIMVEVKKSNPYVTFLIENVKMKKDFEDYITHHIESALGKISKYSINSALVSAQNRNRNYWTNISNVSDPVDKKIFLKDIIEAGVVDREKSYCIDANYFKGGNLKNYFKKSRRQIQVDDETSFLSCIQSGEADINAIDVIRRTYDINGKSPALTACGGGHREPKITTSETTWRKLTPLECERLQTVYDNHTLVPHPVYKNKMMSNSQRYKMLGNGWTVDVIAHILSFMNQGDNND